MSQDEITVVDLVQNEAFAAHLLWSFGRGFQQESVGDQASLPSLFLVLPLVLHGPTLREIKSTNLPSGLSGAVKLGRWFGRIPLSQVFSLLQVKP